MQAIASSTNERMPIMCDGSNFSYSRGGIRKPVALVKMVNSRNIAVRPGIRLEPRSPNMTIMPATMPIRLMMTCTVTNVDRLIPRIMMRSPFWSGAMLRLRIENCHLRAAHGGNSAMGIDQKKRSRCPSFLHGCHKPRRHCGCILAIEKFDQFRDHLVRRFFHQPVAPAFDEYALDIGRDHLALLDQERTAGFFA